MIPMPSQKLIDFSVCCEVSSKAYFEKRLQKPTWPGGRSGITEGIGYDLGYTSTTELQKDWDSIAPGPMISAMEHCLGIRGSRAHALLSFARRKIMVNWDQSMKVFLERDVPKYTQLVIKHIPAAAKLPPDCLGVLFSLCMNRGPSFDEPGDRFREMRAIKRYIEAGDLDKVPAEIESMVRLWPKRNERGLRLRRMHEAQLWREGLKKSAPATVTPKANPNPPQAFPPAPAGAKEHGSAAATVVATAAAAKEAASSGFDVKQVLLIVVIGIIIAAIVWLGIRQHQKENQPTLANIKDRPEPSGAKA